jgi:hypothetical protein
MSKVITFSRTFPGYHPRKGEPTYFVEKVCKSLSLSTLPCSQLLKNGLPLFIGDLIEPKHHTIRTGHRWKVGDWFSPRVWSGKPYNSKQIQFAPDIQIKKIWDFDIHGTDRYLNGRMEYALVGDGFDCEVIAKNNGLTLADFDDWFTLSPTFKRELAFSGQIICWNESIEY